MTIFLTSHDARDIELLAQRSIVINHGKIIFDESTENLKKNYIKSKVIELFVEEAIENFNFAGGKIIEQDKFSIKIELNTAENSIDKLLAYAMDNFAIKDTNISDPAMKEIITDIYRGQKQ